MKKINIKLIASIILTYFVLINYGFSETYVCSYKWGDEIRMNPQEKRTGSTFTSIYEDGSEYEYKNLIEYEDRIILVDSINTVFFKVIWKNKKTFSMVGLNSDDSKNTAIINGKCTVTE